MKKVDELIVLGLCVTQLPQCLAPLLIVTERISSADYLDIVQPQARPKLRGTVCISPNLLIKCWLLLRFYVCIAKLDKVSILPLVSQNLAYMQFRVTASFRSFLWFLSIARHAPLPARAFHLL